MDVEVGGGSFKNRKRQPAALSHHESMKIQEEASAPQGQVDNHWAVVNMDLQATQKWREQH